MRKGRRLRSSRSKPIEAIDNVVAANFRTLRLAAGLTQDELSFRSGYSATTLRKMEKGRQVIVASQLSMFAEIFDCPESAFFAGLPETGSTGAKVVAMNKEIRDCRNFMLTADGRQVNHLVAMLPYGTRKTIIGLVKGLANG